MVSAGAVALSRFRPGDRLREAVDEAREALVIEIRQLLEHPRQHRIDRLPPVVGQHLQRADLILGDRTVSFRVRNAGGRISVASRPSASSIAVNGHCWSAHAASSRSSIRRSRTRSPRYASFSDA